MIQTITAETKKILFTFQPNNGGGALELRGITDILELLCGTGPSIKLTALFCIGPASVVDASATAASMSASSSFIVVELAVTESLQLSTLMSLFS